MLKWIARLRRPDSKTPGFLGRLRRDIRGNTLAIVGAALVPIAAMIGSGVDMSRAYMARTRLQSACDSAALAGRRVMQNDTVNQAVVDEARRFFNFNFNQGLYNTAAFTPDGDARGAGDGSRDREHDHSHHDHAHVRLHHLAAGRVLRRVAELR